MDTEFSACKMELEEAGYKVEINFREKRIVIISSTFISDVTKIIKICSKHNCPWSLSVR